jgi:hypothetical protein
LIALYFLGTNCSFSSLFEGFSVDVFCSVGRSGCEAPLNSGGRGLKSEARFLILSTSDLLIVVADVGVVTLESTFPFELSS